MQRDLFGRLLGIAVDQKLDLGQVFRFPLTPMPLSLCHVDGSIHKTDKSAPLKSLKSQIKSCEPSNVSLIIIDGFFVLHTIKEIPVQYGKTASKCLNVFFNHDAKEIAVMFDSFFSPSFKDNKHLLRDNTEDRQFRITGPGQKRCTDFTKDLKNINFKIALIEFFIGEWSKDEYASNLKTKRYMSTLSSATNSKSLTKKSFRRLLENYLTKRTKRQTLKPCTMFAMQIEAQTSS